MKILSAFFLCCIGGFSQAHGVTQLHGKLTLRIPTVGVISDGDSITAGAGVQPCCYYPTVALAGMSLANSLRNTAVAGYTTQSIIDHLSTVISPQLSAWTGLSKRVYTLMIGTNDNFNTSNYSKIQTICATVVAAGASMVMFTNLPCTGCNETNRQSWNTLIRNGGACSYTVADVGNDPTIGQAGDNLNLTYYQDGTHPKAAGDAIIATYVVTALQSLGVN